jgi:hypothetical protein
MKRRATIHAICAACWDTHRLPGLPAKTKAPPLETCCYCEAPTRSGITVREDPKDVLCKGKHETEEL